MEKSYIAVKYRIYPTNEQMAFFQKTFGCCRFVYNLMLTIQKELYDRNKLHLNKYDSFTFMTSELKTRFPFLKEVDSLALMNSCFDLDEAYKHFFNSGAGFPRFKSRKYSRLSYTTNNQNGTVVIYDKYIRLPKIGPIKAKLHRLFPSYTVKQATVSCEGDKYYCSILYEYTDGLLSPVTVKSIDSAIGLDFNESSLYVDSLGNTGDMPHFYKNHIRRLTREQHKLSRMLEKNIISYKTVGNKRYPIFRKPLSECKNIQKQRNLIKRIHKHISEQRKDFLHKRSNQITNDYDLICVEDISIKDMMLTKDTETSVIKRHNVNSTALENGWYSFTVMLQYKAERKGKTVIKVPKYFPSSQMCSHCRYINHAIKDLNIRNWVCPECGTSHDRDVNAALNIRKKGYEIYCTQ